MCLLTLQLNCHINGPTTILDAACQLDGTASADDAPRAQAASWLDDMSPPTKPRTKRRKSKKTVGDGDVPEDIEDAVIAWFGQTWEPESEAQGRWSAEDWWRSNESRFPKIAKLARRVLATQVRPHVTGYPMDIFCSAISFLDLQFANSG